MCRSLLPLFQSQSAPPGAYQVQGAIGAQVSSTKQWAPGIKIGTSMRALDYEVRVWAGGKGEGEVSRCTVFLVLSASFQTCARVGPCVAAGDACRVRRHTNVSARRALSWLALR